MAAAPLNPASFPDLGVPIAQPESLVVTESWMRLFLALWQRTGGSASSQFNFTAPEGQFINSIVGTTVTSQAVQFQFILGQLALQQFPNLGPGDFYANLNTSEAGPPVNTSLSVYLDTIVGASPGLLLSRDVGVWDGLEAGSNGNVLTSQGPGLPLEWAPPVTPPFTVTDGTTTVTDVTEINFTSGATVTAGGAGIADVAISGGGGGGGAQPIIGSGWAGPVIPPLTNFTFVNNPSSAIATLATDGHLVLTVPIVSGIDVTIFAQAAPATPWSQRFLLEAMWFNTPSIGVMIGNSSGELVFIAGTVQSGQQQVFVQKYSSPTGFISQPFNSDLTFGSNIWFEIADDGTNYTVSVSPNGEIFTEIFSEPLSTFITAISTIGLAVNSNGTLPVQLNAWFIGT